jgi:hypothetical protein
MTMSADGGRTWGAAKTTANRATGTAGKPLVRPDGTVVVPVWLETIGQGAMISYFISSTVLPGGPAVTAFPLATRPDGNTLHQDMYAIRGGMPIRGR